MFFEGFEVAVYYIHLSGIFSESVTIFHFWGNSCSSLVFQHSEKNCSYSTVFSLNILPGVLTSKEVHTEKFCL